MRKIVPIILIILNIILFWSGCGAKSKQPVVIEKPVSNVKADRTPGEIRSQMKLLFPEDGLIPGWRKATETELFDKSNLYEHIDGAAEAFFAYDFQLCGSAEYNPQALPEIEADQFIVVDIYDMGRSINAFGMYTSEFSSESEPVDIGAQGYAEYSVLNFWKGPYYVKIVASSLEENTAKANMELAKLIDQRIPDKAEKPSMLSLLPAEGLISGTEKFILNNILGYNFLKNGLMATYKMDSEEKALIIMEYESDDEAKKVFAQFTNYEEKSDTDMAKTEDLGEEGFIVNDKYHKRIITVRQGRYLVMVTSISDEVAAKSLVKKAIDKINLQMEGV